MQCFSELFIAIFALIFCFSSVFAVPLEKKADISRFTSAINSAGRLRYGKRSDPVTIWEENSPSVEEYISPEEGRYPYALIKRALNTDSLVASLNAAERLRFGRK
uniref:Uncharacterized protein n=1 Tax=Caenorhabditis japonica TaxID=281687 RepID=A0A8R1I4C7_CAEJA